MGIIIWQYFLNLDSIEWETSKEPWLNPMLSETQLLLVLPSTIPMTYIYQNNNPDFLATVTEDQPTEHCFTVWQT